MVAFDNVKSLYNGYNNTSSSCVQSFVVVPEKGTSLIELSRDWIGQVESHASQLTKVE